MAPLAIALFVLLFAFGDQILGLHDSDLYMVQAAILASYVFGIICGMKVKG